MDENALLFFQQDIEVLPLYERLEGLILDRIADVQIKVQNITGICLPASPLAKSARPRIAPPTTLWSPLAWITVWNPPESTWLPSLILTAGPIMY